LKDKLVILDRDGVINKESPEYIKSTNEWHAISGSLEAIAKLNKNGYLVCVATNQSGIARGLFTEETLIKIHEKMQDELSKVGGVIDQIVYCPHHPKDNCACRKPKPGLLFQIQDHFKVDLSKSYMVGDALRDIKAGIAALAKPIFISGSHPYEHLKSELKGVPVFKDLESFVNDLLKENDKL